MEVEEFEEQWWKQDDLYCSPHQRPRKSTNVLLIFVPNPCYHHGCCARRLEHIKNSCSWLFSVPDPYVRAACEGPERFSSIFWGPRGDFNSSAWSFHLGDAPPSPCSFFMDLRAVVNLQLCSANAHSNDFGMRPAAVVFECIKSAILNLHIHQSHFATSLRGTDYCHGPLVFFFLFFFFLFAEIKLEGRASLTATATAIIWEFLGFSSGFDVTQRSNCDTATHKISNINQRGFGRSFLPHLYIKWQTNDLFDH